LASGRPALPPTPFGPWPPSRLGPAGPSPSLTCEPQSFIFLLRPLGHEAVATGRPSAAGSPFDCPVDLLPLPLTDAPPHLLSPLWLPTSLASSRPKWLAIKPPPNPLCHSAHELPPLPYKSHREHPRTAPALLTPSFTSLLAQVSLSPAHRPPPPSPSSCRRSAAFRAPVRPELGTPCFPLPPPPLVR
jgi:hypothetical protein